LSFAFIRALYASEDVFERLLPDREYLRHALGMMIVGGIGAVLWRCAGHLYVEGVGYATILDVLSGTLSSVGFLLVLLVLKLVATCLTLGSGASGGVFSPSLFMGAMLGAAYGAVLRAVFPSLGAEPAALALAGMAGVVAGGTGAVLTAIVMIFEMTLDYSVILPMTVTAAVSFGLRRSLTAESIYSMKLSRRGHHMPHALHANVHLVRHASDLPLGPAFVVSAEAALSEILADMTSCSLAALRRCRTCSRA
jgi:CIC family chloride channel protein